MSNYVMELRKLVGPRPLVVAGACVIVLNDRGQLLLQHRVDNDMWGLPGGSLEPGESLEETARREALEEVGLTCGTLELFGVYSGPQVYYRYPHGDEIHNVIAAYLCRDFSGREAVADAESKAVKWWPLGKLPEALCPPDRVVLADLLQRTTRSGE